MKFSVDMMFPCPCCNINYKFIRHFYIKKTGKFIPMFYADNKQAQGLYQFNKEKYNIKKEPLYFYAKPKLLENGNIKLSCARCEAEFEILQDGKTNLISSKGSFGE